MYADYGRGQLVGMPFFQRWADDLSRHDYCDLALYQMSHFDEFYVRDFFLGTPFLWQPDGPELWVRILLSAPRPDTSKMIDLYSPAFGDVEFLSCFVNVDALGYLIRSSEIADVKRQALLAYFRRAGPNLVPEEVKDERLDGILAVGKEIAADLNRNLCRDFGFQKVTFDGWTVNDYVDELALG